jgi:hypothetical protein
MNRKMDEPPQGDPYELAAEAMRDPAKHMSLTEWLAIADAAWQRTCRDCAGGRGDVRREAEVARAGMMHVLRTYGVSAAERDALIAETIVLPLPH